MEFTHGFVLETKDGLPVGFALGSPSFKVNTGECIFMLHTGSVGVIETPLAIAISELKVTGEHFWKKENGGISVRSEGRIFLVIEHDGAVLDGNRKDIGMAKPLPENT